MIFIKLEDIYYVLPYNHNNNDADNYYDFALIYVSIIFRWCQRSIAMSPTYEYLSIALHARGKNALYFACVRTHAPIWPTV